MSSSFPEVGEVWRNHISQVDAIVAKVEGSLVTFVSLTGVRFPLQFNSKASEGIWELRDEVPDRHYVVNYQECSHLGCKQKAFIQYERLLTQLPEVVCPLHIPKGVQSSLVIRGLCPIETVSFEGQVCTQCGGDATEVLNALPIEHQEDSFWNCQKCGRWWVHTAFELDLDKFVSSPEPDRLLEDLYPSGYEFCSIEINKDLNDTELKDKFFDIYVKPCLGATLKGPRSLTLYDYVKLDDDF